MLRVRVAKSRFEGTLVASGGECLKGKIKSEKERFEDSELTDWFLAIDACLA
jgi:hypothetical protein